MAARIPQLPADRSRVDASRIERIATRVSKAPEGIPGCIYISYKAAPSHTAARRHALERESEDYALPTLALPPLVVNVDTSWRDIPKLFNWDLLDGTLPNALPASSRIHRELQDPKPRGTPLRNKLERPRWNRGDSAILAALSDINLSVVPLTEEEGPHGNAP